LAKAIALLELANPARPWFIERLRAIIAIAIFASKILQIRGVLYHKMPFWP
jgi:hypothetical protein